MSASDPIPSGFAPSQPWPESGAPVEFRLARSAEVLTHVEDGAAPYWALNPYSGCEFACTYCRARELPPFQGADPRVFERDIHGRANAAEAIARAVRERSFSREPLVLGTTCDPWQPVEKSAQLTRAALEVLARYGEGIDLRAQTRSTLAPRDADLLVAIARRGKVSVSFSLATLDRKLCRLLEPFAPTPDRRFIAMEALARAGVRVGLIVAPVLMGLEDSLPAFERLLRRARDAGAGYAAVAPLSMGAAARIRMVRYVSRFDPELATRYDRLLARTADREPGAAESLRLRFAEACERVGVAFAGSRGQRASAARGAADSPHDSSSCDGPRQLSLFAALPPAPGR